MEDIYDILLKIIEDNYSDGKEKFDLVADVKALQKGTKPAPVEPEIPSAVLAAQKALADAQKALEEAQAQAGTTVTTTEPPLQR